jgi:hypothetical protein
VGNKGGWLLKAIKENYTNPKFAEQQQEKFRQEIHEKIAEINREKEPMRKVHEEKCEAIFQAMVEKEIEAVNEAMQEVVAENRLGQFYDASKPFIKQAMMVQVMTKKKLREKFPDAFKAVNEEYERAIAEIDKRIEELKAETKPS